MSATKHRREGGRSFDFPEISKHLSVSNEAKEYSVMGGIIERKDHPGVSIALDDVNMHPSAELYFLL